jgi:RND family efflux transporter MFP subunit
MRTKLLPIISIVLLTLCLLLIILFRPSRNLVEIKKGASALVQVESVQPQQMAKTLESYGTVNFASDRIQQLNVPNEVWIQQLYVTPGQAVTRNQPLIALVPTADVNLNLENAKITADFARKEVTRIEYLLTQYLATNTEVQVAKADLAKAESSLKILLQQQKATGHIIRSMCDCTILTINVQPGQVMAPNATLMTYSHSGDVQIRLGVASEDLKSIRVGQQVIVTPLYNNARPLTGYISQVTNQINPTTGKVDIMVTTGGSAGLLPGSVVKGEIMLQPTISVLAVPRSAVLFQNNQPYVFVDNEGQAELRWVKIGEDNGKYIVILSGLKANEKVVVVGNYELENGMRLRMEQHR